MTMHSNKIDDILTGITPSAPNAPVDEKQADILDSDTAPHDNQDNDSSDYLDSSESPAKSQDVKEAKETKETKEAKDVKETKEAKEASEGDESYSNDHDVDEYGNAVSKPRMYSEDEVQRIIRDRLSRGNHGTPQQQAQIQQAAEGFQADPNSDQSWETQLEAFVEKTISKVTTKQQTLEWQRKEQQAQAEFESKFTTNMKRYGDFEKVVGEMPITDAMMVATRDMKDPAAFIYAASKLHAEEIRRIAALTNPIQQGVEIGRLEEKMRKARNLTKAAPPLKETKSDMAPKYVPKQRIEDRIDQYARQRKR